MELFAFGLAVIGIMTGVWLIAVSAIDIRKYNTTSKGI